MKMRICYRLAFVLGLLLTPAFSAPDREAPRVTTCRLAYPYSARDGLLTCAGEHYRTFYPHPVARRARRLPAGVVLTLEYVPGWGCGNGCWMRVLRIGEGKW